MTDIDLNFVFAEDRDAVNLVGEVEGELEEVFNAERAALTELYDAINENKGKIYLALAKVEDGEIVAFTYGRISKRTALAGWIVVAEDYRREGVAKKLHDFVCEQLGEMGVRTMIQVAATEAGKLFLERNDYELDENGKYSLAI